MTPLGQHFRRLLSRTLILPPAAMSDYGADDSLTEDIWAYPSDTAKDAQPAECPKTPKTPKTPKEHKTSHNEPESAYDREAVLRKELEGIKSVNRAVEGIISTLERTKGNMNVRAPILRASPLCGPV